MSLSSDLNNIKHHGGKSVAELSEFFAKMKGRSPQEVLGLVTSSSLLRATVQSTFIMFVFMAGFTVGPYLYWGPPETAAKPADKPAAATTAPSDKKGETATPAPAPTTDAQATSAATEPKSDVEKAAKAMGMDEVKSADAKKNPLDKNLDNLLDNLK